MKKAIVLSLIAVTVLSGCMRALTPGEAASAKYKKCHPIR